MRKLYHQLTSTHNLGTKRRVVFHNRSAMRNCHTSQSTNAMSAIWSHFFSKAGIRKL